MRALIIIIYRFILNKLYFVLKVQAMYLNISSIYIIPKICLVFLKNGFDNVIEDEVSVKIINENGLYK